MPLVQRPLQIASRSIRPSRFAAGLAMGLITVACAPIKPWSQTPVVDRAVVAPILMYHHVQDLPPNADDVRRTWTVSVQSFTAQMHWLAEHGYHTITLDQLTDHLESAAPLPEKPIVLTFDDGWDIGYGTVFPILRDLHFTGTFFVCPSSIGDHPGSGYMTWPQLREMIAGGMDVQSHTVGHPHLRDIPPEAQRREIVDSKRMLEEKLGRPIHALAYPFGQFNEAIIQLVKDAKYRCAVTIESGYIQRESDRYTLHRTRISYGDTLDTFREWVTYP